MNVTRPRAAALTALPTILFAASVLTAIPAADAQQTAVSFTSDVFGVEATASQQVDGSGNFVYNESASYNLGFQFSVSSPVAVTHLGFFADPYYYDPANPHYNNQDTSTAGQQPYAQSHPVGVYLVVPATGSTDEIDTLLFSATVTQDSVQSGYFRYAAPTLAPGSTGFVLMPGADYVISGVTGADDPYFEDVQRQSDGTSAVVMAPGISYGQDRYAVGGSLTDQPTFTDPYGEPGFFGPNLQFTSVAGAPEPSEWAALGFSGLSVGGLLLKARKRRAAELVTPDADNA